MSKYGYIGPDSATPTQSPRNNTGVFSITDQRKLLDVNKFTSLGQLELIETQAKASAAAAIDFTNLGNYDVHMMTISDYQAATDGQTMGLRFSVNGGTTFISSGYQWAGQNGQGNGTFSEYRATGSAYLEINRFNGNAARENANAYIYFYHLSDPTHFSHFSYHCTYTAEYTERQAFQYGVGIDDTALGINAIRLFANSGNCSADVSLYGVKYYE